MADSGAKPRPGKEPSEGTPLMLDAPLTEGHRLPMFLDKSHALSSGRWKALMEAVVSKVSGVQCLLP